MARDVEVVFTKEKKGSFTIGQTKTVKPGYAFNYLFPFNLAVPNTPEFKTTIDSIQKEAEKHGIEYQAEDFRGNEDRVWQEISLAVPADVRDSMTLVSKQGSGCELVETWESEAQKEKLVWLPAQQIVVSYENPVLAWSLTEQGDSGLQQRLVSRDDYTLIDFADIGDSEENPFVKKMINWGFVEHGASGFYDEHGHAIEGHGHAH